MKHLHFTPEEKEISLISNETELKGVFHFSGITRIHGKIEGTLIGKSESEIILCQNSYTTGEIQADKLIIDGYFEGKIKAKTSVTITSLGRVIGSIKSPNLKMEAGAFFEGDVISGEKVNRTSISNHPISGV